MLNAQMVKIWMIGQLITLKTQVNHGTIDEVVGRAKIDQLEEFYDTFNLDYVSLEGIESTSGSDLSHIVSHIPKQHKLTNHEKIKVALNGD